MPVFTQLLNHPIDKCLYSDAKLNFVVSINVFVGITCSHDNALNIYRLGLGIHCCRYAIVPTL